MKKFTCNHCVPQVHGKNRFARFATRIRSSIEEPSIKEEVTNVVRQNE